MKRTPTPQAELRHALALDADEQRAILARLAGIETNDDEEEDDDLDHIERAARKTLHPGPVDVDAILAAGLGDDIEGFTAAILAKIEALKKRADRAAD